MAKRPYPELSIYLRCFAAEDPGDWSAVLDQADAADAAGIDRLLVSDHVAFGERLENYARPELGGIKGGTQPTGPDGCWLEPLTLLSVVAGRTRRIRLRTQILLAALRRPVVLAKTAATLDVLSGGRLELGVGVGWQREEYEAAGLPFEGRGRLLDHSLEVCQALWRDSCASYSSPELQFANIHQMPKPHQAGGVPIWVSGTVRKSSATRLARFGVGWIPWGTDIDDLADTIPRMREAVAAAGGDPAAMNVQGNLPIVRRKGAGIDLDATMAGVQPLIEQGVTDFVAGIQVPTGRQAAEDALFPLAQAFRATTGRG